MPLTNAGNKIKRNFHKEYGDKQGDKIFYSKENKDKKFKKRVTGKKSIWWAERITKLPETAKSDLFIILEDYGDIKWWARRMSTLRAAQARPADKKFGEQPNIPRELEKSEHEGHLVTDDKGKKHLPTHSNGKPNHRLMGAAAAALTSSTGYRGNKYEGPDKSVAIAKLKRLYRKEGMEFPKH